MADVMSDNTLICTDVMKRQKALSENKIAKTFIEAISFGFHLPPVDWDPDQPPQPSKLVSV